MKTLQFAAWIILAFTLALPAYAQSAASRPRITGISHLSVYTTDGAKAEAFYVHDLGATKKADPENPRGVRYYFSPTQFVEVLPLAAGGASINRLDHAAFNTASAAGLKSYLAAHGFPALGEVKKGSDGSRWFAVHDPEGNTVEFVQPPAKPAAIPVSSLSGHIIHFGYLVHDAAAENAFYRTVLGFRPYWHGGRTDTETDWISQQVPNGTDWIEYMMVHSPQTKGIPASVTRASLGSMDHFSLGVQNMEKSVDLLYSGDRLNGKYNGPRIGRDGKWQLNMYDPDSTRAEVMEFQPAVKPCCSEFTASSPTR
ncbi:MAG TPA: VOC family protein [Acidobacteriaceae bacterium]|nr:VOC family protein [Acidobacteriaceae bacterium]